MKQLYHQYKNLLIIVANRQIIVEVLEFWLDYFLDY
jgi:hypothetical protein